MWRREHRIYEPASNSERFTLALGGLLLGCGLAAGLAPAVTGADTSMSSETVVSSDSLAAESSSGFNPYYTAAIILGLSGAVTLSMGIDQRRDRHMGSEIVMPEHDMAELTDDQEKAFRAMRRQFGEL